MQQRTLVIGDIHGAFKALVQVLDKAAVTTHDQLIFLGDYVDGWSQSREVISYLQKLSLTHNCIFIRGNHDAWCEDWLATGNGNETWLFHGGSSTLNSYQNIDEEEKQEHLEFFNYLKNYHVDESNNLFIHAGYSSMHGPQRETYSSNYRWDRTLWETALATDTRIEKESRLYPKRLKLFNEIYIGHTPTLDFGSMEPMNAVNVWNVDTGAAFYGKLSVLEIETKKFWQSDMVQQLYPNEKGRNKD